MAAARKGAGAKKAAPAPPKWEKIPVPDEWRGGTLPTDFRSGFLASWDNTKVRCPIPSGWPGTMERQRAWEAGKLAGINARALADAGHAPPNNEGSQA